AKGRAVYNIALAIDPNCPMKAAAVQLVKNALAQFGDILAAFPDDASLSEQIDVLEFALASSAPVESIEGKCRIPSIISNVLVERASPNGNQEIPQTIEVTPADETDVLGISEKESESAPEETAAASGSASLTNAKLRVDAERIDAVLNLVGELVIGKSMLMQATGEFEKRFGKDPLRAKLSDAMAFQARVLNDLQKSVMKIRMVPVEQ